LSKEHPKITLFDTKKESTIEKEPSQYLAMVRTAYLIKCNFSQLNRNYYVFFSWEVVQGQGEEVKSNTLCGEDALNAFAKEVANEERMLELNFLKFVSIREDRKKMIEERVKDARKKLKS
jgi:hypothetical protein